MKAAPHPEQALRLATLHRYEILDTPRESDFDDIVELASQICGTPIAVVNLIDEDRQWFKAEVGIGARETPLETSICSHVILSSDFVEIRDTHTDARTCDNELCTPADGLRFYAGALLKAGNGMPIGTLCVLDNKPNQLTPFQRKALATLARRVMHELDLRLALRSESILRDEMDHRVKNSLQSVASIVRLYRNRLGPDENPAEAFDAIARRIESVAALHAALSGSPDAQSVTLDEFLPRIADLLRASSPDNLEIVCTPGDARVSAQVAAAISIVVSEFVANSIKHAFPDGGDGRVVIAAHANARGDITILCEDNGSTGDAPLAASPIEGLGSRLVAASAAQIGATLTRGRQADGYRLEMTIPATRL